MLLLVHVVLALVRNEISVCVRNWELKTWIWKQNHLNVRFVNVNLIRRVNEAGISQYLNVLNINKKIEKVSKDNRENLSRATINRSSILTMHKAKCHNT